MYRKLSAQHLSKFRDVGQNLYFKKCITTSVIQKVHDLNKKTSSQTDRFYITVEHSPPPPPSKHFEYRCSSFAIPSQKKSTVWPSKWHSTTNMTSLSLSKRNSVWEAGRSIIVPNLESKILGTTVQSRISLLLRVSFVLCEQLAMSCSNTSLQLSSGFRLACLLILTHIRGIILFINHDSVWGGGNRHASIDCYVLFYSSSKWCAHASTWVKIIIRKLAG